MEDYDNRNTDDEQTANNKLFIVLITFLDVIVRRVAYFIIIKEGRKGVRVWDGFFEAGRFSSAKCLL